ncbi:N-acetyl-gamma-glutamyl-phosphate reductase [Pelotomaculum propionicicum]|uniref:N-acetyl-gamma-glutamyl-phosphate reductase n=1 Tax=Pelotomaculum propionicicum TaxID=258475 RepID=UPI003B7835E5
MTVKVGIIGATGYTGSELVRILYRHPEVELVSLTTRSYAGMPLHKVYPHLNKYCQLTCEELDRAKIFDISDVVFVALPHGHAMPVAVEAARRGKKMIDLGADFRFSDFQVYEKWYKVEHEAKDLLEEAVYGLPEVNRDKIKGAWLVANPGCYPTSAILALAPLLQQKLIDTGSIVVDSKSGVSGAGRGLSLGSHFCEVNENFKAYNVAAHRHTPEIEQALSRIAGEQITVTFTPHLLPITRGILSTVYAKLSSDASVGRIRELYRDYYENEFFVRVLPDGTLPQTKWVAGTNHCDIGVTVDERTGRVIVISAIDNVVKGASGQAVQNMNIICNLPEDTALAGPGLYP